jgi:hypothetical protein
MRRLLLLPCLAFGLSSALNAQAPMVSLIRQPRATALEFTAPWTEFQFQDGEDHARFHLGAGLGIRHWDDGDTAARLLVDANTTFDEVFFGFGTVVEVPPGEKPFLGPRVRVGWAFHPNWALSLEGEHLERPFGDSWGVKRRSALGVALTYRF